MDKLLKKKKKSKAGIEWAQNFSKDEDKVIEWIEQCGSQKKFWKHKGKGIFCTALGAC